ncbi:hypothetical protein LC613_07080 [Nostoc sphaeroides CHAB 2801]|uniref:hypothetical protein n=1 Tax=Nostoc sphaeroides TaxID=446679 RepID=UPI000E50EE7C|nr:hypothetical protein [Nostoc sphaeroides]MCC5627912.1 hypothetical protein [Nostoc sphaeroides CHAB 2801]
MLGFVPQPNLRGLRFLALTQAYCPMPQYRSVKPKNLGKDAKFRVSTGLKSVPQIPILLG